MEIGVVVDADPGRDFPCVRDLPEHEMRRERRRVVVDDEIKAADFGYSCGILGACRGIDCDEISGIFDDAVAKDRVPEIGPAGHTFGLGRFGASQSRQRKPENQSGSTKQGWGHSHSSSL